MAYWLVKSEPEAWSWERHAAAGVEPWDGVRNHQANNNMKAMAASDQALFYHSGRDKSIRGVLEVVRKWYPDPQDASGRFGMVDFKALFPLPRPVPLAEVKAEPRLAHIALVKHTRLSVMPIDDNAWRLLCRMGGVEDTDEGSGAS
ncbi:MAG: EVE domain-containing protein [Rhodospirillales bacterium]|nr:EVE domain-containing protein [Rhodospirillales bacterium]